MISIILIIIVVLLVLTSTSSSKAQSAHGLSEMLGKEEHSSSSSRLELVRKTSLGAFLMSSPLSQSTLPRLAWRSWSLWAAVKTASFSYQNLAKARYEFQHPMVSNPKPVSCAKPGKLLSEKANQSGSDPATLHWVLHKSTNLLRGNFERTSASSSI